MPGSVTTKDSKYSTRSISRRVMSRNRPMRDGRDLRNQIWATGLASSMWPMRSRRTLARVTSTPHFSQTMPRCFKRMKHRGIVCEKCGVEVHLGQGHLDAAFFADDAAVLHALVLAA